MPAERFVGEPGRLDAVLARLTGLPRADVQRAIAAGRVTVDGDRPPEVVPRSWAASALEIEIDDERTAAARGTRRAGPVRGRAPARDRQAAGL